ncbi:HET-C-related protein [Pseudomonas sp. Irchel 3A5]|uniref:HET-C-related protein n=1 Tax=Pseudomonas sp. Irchel 3A5 TaxID=2008911 RepID=UPI0015953E1C|nr:HET-C-related protein [Pseudomonas sp. Irchel 3A5]
MNPPIASPKKNNRYINQLMRGGKTGNAFAFALRMEPGRLDSTFALDLLTRLAHDRAAPQFIMEMATIFGLDIPPKVYLELQKALLADAIPLPRYKIVSSGTYPADYNNRDRTVRIHAQALEHIVKHPEAAWELLAVLLHEFGHHLDDVIRRDIAPLHAQDTLDLHSDSVGEEGARYATHMARSGMQEDGDLILGTYVEGDNVEYVIKINYAQGMRAVRERQSDIARMDGDAIDPDREAFEADGSGDGLFSHERIEAGLQAIGFADEDLQAMYFGNWLRDHAQLLDPKVVRGKDQKKDFPAVMSREALTAVVDVMAARKFSGLRAKDSFSYKVTEKKLGVYRPSHHIDNPKVENPTPADPAERDPEFEPWVLADDPLLEVDYETSMKSYIHRSAAKMYRELSAAMREGYTPEGLRKLGGALHILEDFFAHSNFVELNLISLNHKGVLPWTGPADCKHKLPLVTGTFGGSDTVASLAGPIAKILAPAELWKFTPTKPGARSDSEQMLLILLNEHDEAWLLEAFQDFLAARDKASSIPGFNLLELYYWVISSPLRLAGNAYSAIFQGILQLIGNSIDDIQTHTGPDPHRPGNTDPSHSQLSKDHANHPLHKLAANCASSAIREVAGVMLNYWRFGSEMKPTEIALSYFVHPEDTYQLDDIFLEWASKNPEQIKRASSLTELEHLQQELLEVARKNFQGFAKESLGTWDYLKKLGSSIGLKDVAEIKQRQSVKAMGSSKAV